EALSLRFDRGLRDVRQSAQHVVRGINGGQHDLRVEVYAVPARQHAPSLALPPQPDEVSLVGILTTIVRRWRVVLGLPLLLAAVTGLAAMLLPPTYDATTTFVPETRRQNQLPTALMGLAMQMGMSIGVEPSQSARFYGDLVRSREILERTLLSRYADPKGALGDSTTLLRIL